MNREYHRWFSPSLGKDMELLLFGHAGYPYLVFPTSMGRFYEYEDRGMVESLANELDAGRLQLICIDSVDQESWYNRNVHPKVRVARHLQYERYMLDEVFPLMRERAGHATGGKVGVTGCSLGAFHASLVAFRHPATVGALLALSGKYENSTFLHGYADEDTYFTNPLAFLPGLRDSSSLAPLHDMNIAVVTGSTDPHVHEARELSQVLRGLGVSHTLDVWDGWVHDWPYWRAMARKYLADS